MARILTRLWGPPLSAETAPAPPPTPSPTPTPSPSPTPPPPRTSPVPPPTASARPPSYMTPHPASSTTTPPHTSPAPPPGASPSSTPTPTLPPLPPPTPAPPSPAAPPRVSPAPRTSPAPAPCPPAASPSPAPTPTLPLLPSPTPAPPLPPVAPPRISRTSPAAPLGTPAASPSSASTPTPSPLASPTPAPLVPAPLSLAPPPSSEPLLPTPPMLLPRAATGIGPLPHCPPPQLPPRPSPTLAELPRNITASALSAGTSPPPCACAAPPPQPQSIEKGASLFGLLTPVVLSTFPFIYQVHTGSIHKTTELFGTPAMVSAFINSIIWLMYGIVISKSDMSPTLLLLHAFTCMSTFTYLMFVYADRKATVKGYMLASSFILSLSVIFTVLYWDLIPSWIMEELFGCLGLGSLVYCHCIQISNILDGITERSQKIATAINLLPSCLVNLETMMITAQRHPNHGFILMSSTLGFAANVLEIFLAIIVTLGNLFSSTGNRSVDLEAAVQNVGRANVSAGLPTNDLAVVFGSENSIAGSTQAQHQHEATDTIIMQLQAIIRCQIEAIRHPSSYTRVVLVQAIPRVPLQIERDAYLPMLLQISGLADARPDLMVIMNLELRYWLQLRWRLEVSQRRIAAAAETSMEQRNSMKRKQLLTEESLGSQSKRIKKAQTTWRVQLPRPYALRKFRIPR